MYSDVIREREELSEQIRALEDLKTPGYYFTGFDISRPAADVKEAIQWTYFGYLDGCEGAERSCHVPWTHLHLPGHLR
mgnify:CR=1 FL=1